MLRSCVHQVVPLSSALIENLSMRTTWQTQRESKAFPDFRFTSSLPIWSGSTAAERRSGSGLLRSRGWKKRSILPRTNAQLT